MKIRPQLQRRFQDIEDAKTRNHHQEQRQVLQVESKSMIQVTCATDGRAGEEELLKPFGAQKLVCSRCQTISYGVLLILLAICFALSLL